jgi:hypothetical protein
VSGVPQKARTVGDEPSMQCCPLTWVRGRPRSHRKPIRHHPQYSLCRIHHHASSFVRLLFPIHVGPSANFLHHAGQEHVPQPYWETLHIPPRLHGPLGSHLYSDWGHPRLYRGSFDALLLGYLRVRVFSSELPLVNVLHRFSRNGRERCSSFRNGTNAVNLVYELLPLRVVAC